MDRSGMRIIAYDGIIDADSLYCAGDRIVLLEMEMPKVGNCEIGIFQHESLLAFARIKGRCEAFCPGKESLAPALNPGERQKRFVLKYADLTVAHFRHLHFQQHYTIAGTIQGIGINDTIVSNNSHT